MLKWLCLFTKKEPLFFIAIVVVVVVVDILIAVDAGIDVVVEYSKWIVPATCSSNSFCPLRAKCICFYNDLNGSGPIKLTILSTHFKTESNSIHIFMRAKNGKLNDGKEEIWEREKGADRIFGVLKNKDRFIVSFV